MLKVRILETMVSPVRTLRRKTEVLLSDEEAHSLVRHGLAVYVDEKAEKKPDPTEKELNKVIAVAKPLTMTKPKTNDPKPIKNKVQRRPVKRGANSTKRVAKGK